MMYSQSVAWNMENIHHKTSLVAILSDNYTGHATPPYTLNNH